MFQQSFVLGKCKDHYPVYSQAAAGDSRLSLQFQIFLLVSKQYWLVDLHRLHIVTPKNPFLPPNLSAVNPAAWLWERLSNVTKGNFINQLWTNYSQLVAFVSCLFRPKETKASPESFLSETQLIQLSFVSTIFSNSLSKKNSIA